MNSIAGRGWQPVRVCRIIGGLCLAGIVVAFVLPFLRTDEWSGVAWVETGRDAGYQTGIGWSLFAFTLVVIGLSVSAAVGDNRRRLAARVILAVAAVGLGGIVLTIALGWMLSGLGEGDDRSVALLGGRIGIGSFLVFVPVSLLGLALTAVARRRRSVSP